MMRYWLKLLYIGELARLDTIAAAVANTTLVVSFAYHVEHPATRSPDLPDRLWLAVLLGTMVAAGLSGYGAAFNDILDRRHDRAFQPERPLASGRLRLTTALVVAVTSLLLAILAASWLGRAATMLSLAAALAVTAFNVAGKFVPAVGVVLLGLIWALSMVIPNPQITFAWPVWLVMSHVMAVATFAHLLQGKRPTLRPIDIALIVAGWAFWTLVLVAWMTWQSPEIPPPAQQGWWVWGLVFTAAVVFTVIAMVRVRRRMGTIRGRREAGAMLGRFGMRWMILYAVAWLLGTNQFVAAGGMAALFLAACVFAVAVHWFDPVRNRMPTYRVGSHRDHHRGDETQSPHSTIRT